MTDDPHFLYLDLETTGLNYDSSKPDEFVQIGVDIACNG